MGEAADNFRKHQEASAARSRVLSEENAIRKAEERRGLLAENAEIASEIDAELLRVTEELRRAEFAPKPLLLEFDFTFPRDRPTSNIWRSAFYFGSALINIEGQDELQAMWPIGGYSGFTVSTTEGFQLQETFEIVFVVPDLSMVVGRKYVTALDNMKVKLEDKRRPGALSPTYDLYKGGIVFQGSNSPVHSFAQPLDYAGDLMDTYVSEDRPSPKHILKLMREYKVE